MDLLLITWVLEGLIMLMIIAIVISAYQLFNRKRRACKDKKSNALLKKIEANAVILNMEETGVYMDRQPLMRLQMRVITDRGQHFVLEIKEVLSRADRESLRNGSLVKIKYNPQSRGEAILVKAC